MLGGRSLGRAISLFCPQRLPVGPTYPSRLPTSSSLLFPSRPLSSSLYCFEPIAPPTEDSAVPTSSGSDSSDDTTDIEKIETTDPTTEDILGGIEIEEPVMPPPSTPQGDLPKYTWTTLFPREVVTELDRNIVGQEGAKKAVAIALRNRWRRQHVPQKLREEIVPKNILMVGPTGVGKTEIARRLAKMVNAPFVKVEATKFTEVGFHGRDVDQIIRDLMDVAILQTKDMLKKQNKDKVDLAVEDKLLELLLGEAQDSSSKNSFRELLRKGMLENRVVMVEDSGRRPSPQPVQGMKGAGVQVDIKDLFQMSFGGGGEKARKKMTVAEARKVIMDEEVDKMFDQTIVTKKAIEAVEETGIVFIDEVDKIVVPPHRSHSADGSSEGVQRDLLPIVEGCVVHTKHGNVDTAKILFVASGAFHSCKPSDMMPELQGRFPIRVELQALSEGDLERILREPEANLILQQQELLKTEAINLEFTDDAVKKIAQVAAELNSTVENIGARRLMTVIERLVEEISYECDTQPEHVVIDEDYVEKQVKDMRQDIDLNRFIL